MRVNLSDGPAEIENQIYRALGVTVICGNTYFFARLEGQKATGSVPYHNSDTRAATDTQLGRLKGLSLYKGTSVARKGRRFVSFGWAGSIGWHCWPVSCERERRTVCGTLTWGWLY